MTNPAAIKTAQEIRTLAGRVAANSLPDEIAETFPVPRRASGNVAMLILYYRETGRPGNRKVSPPEHCLMLDPESGQVLRFWACTLEDLGINRRAPAVPGAGLRPGMTAGEFSDKEDRLLDLSQPIWRAFIAGGVPADAPTRALAREYRQLLLETTKAEVAPYVVGAAPDFFRWLEQAAQ